jgi:hypothetical protein
MLSINLPCLGRREDYGCDGYEYDCGYENSGEITCDDCICCIANGGYYNPKTWRRINYILRKIGACIKYG